MSGGSYNYLCYKDSSQLLSGEADEDLQEMADSLTELKYAEDAAKETQDLLLIIKQSRDRIEASRKRLEAIWHSLEWWMSGDSGENEFKEELEKYRGGVK